MVCIKAMAATKLKPLKHHRVAKITTKKPQFLPLFVFTNRLREWINILIKILRIKNTQLIS